MPTKRDLEAAQEAWKRADKARSKGLSQDDVDAAAVADAENPPATDEELARAWRVSPANKTAAE